MALVATGCGTGEVEGDGGNAVAESSVVDLPRVLSRQDCGRLRAGGIEGASVELGNWGLRYGVACSVVAGAVDRCNMLAGAGMDEKMACIEEKQVPRSYIRLHEKGGRFNEVPAHHLRAASGVVRMAEAAAGRAAERSRAPATVVGFPLYWWFGTGFGDRPSCSQLPS